jgi:hypothetical protein
VLRRFAVPGTRDKAVSVFNVDEGLHVPIASIGGQGAKGSIYGTDGIVEKGFGDLEGRAAIVTASVMKTGQAPPSETFDHVVLTVFTALQHGRTPSAGKEMEASFTQLARAVLRFPGTVPNELQDQIRNWQVTHQQRELFGAFQALQIAPVLDDLATIVVVNNSPVEFLCPDTGVVLHNQWGKPVRGRGVLGYASRGLQILLPIGARVMLCRYDSSVYQPVRKADSITLRKEKDIALINRLLCSSADRLVYFSGSADTLRYLQNSYRSLRRSPRGQSVSTRRFGSTSGREQLVAYHMKQTDEPFPFSWLPVRPSVSTFPIAERGRALREPAMEAAKLIRDRPPPPDPKLDGVVFSRLPD